MQRNSFRFPRSQRLTRGSEIKRIALQGKRLRTKYFEVRAIASPVLHPRVGLVVPKYRHTAVERNRLKRHVREVVRVELLTVFPSVDVVIRARSNAYGVQFSLLRDDLRGVVPEVEKLFP